MKKKICALLVSSMLMLTAFASCGDNDNTSSQGGFGTQYSSTQAGTDVPDDGGEYVPENNSTGDELPAEIDGDWEVADVYQEAMRSDLFADEGLEKEQRQPVHIGIDYYEGYGVRFETPDYTVRQASVSELYDYGFSTESIDRDFTDTVTIIEIASSEDEAYGQVFFLNGASLIKLGSGGHLYNCRKVEAVG